MTKPSIPRLRVLVVDDDTISRRLVTGAISRQFDVIEATNGEEAVAAYTAHRPDVVLLDVEMPVMDGVDAARAIKQLAGDTLVPIFLVSGAEGLPTLARGLAAGADDFLPKPFDIRVFLPKLQVFLRLRAQHERILEQNRALDEFQRTTEFEHALAARIFERMVRRADVRGLRTHLNSLTQFNGDALLAAQTPTGASRVLIADLTGHGLVAAIGSLPLNSAFYDSTSRGDSLEATLIRANREVHAALPRNVFAAAAAFEFDPVTRELIVINAGLPPVFLHHGGRVDEVPSQSAPLGVIPSLAPAPYHVTFQGPASVLAMSDGIVERADASGELFGLERVRSVLQSSSASAAFDALVTAITAYSPKNDDVTLVALDVQG